MVWDALVLLILGMGAVFLFLILLNILISLLAYSLREHTLKEAEQLLVSETQNSRQTSVSESESATLIAVISSAVHQYRTQKISTHSS